MVERKFTERGKAFVVKHYGETATRNGIELQTFEHHDNGTQSTGSYYSKSRDTGFSGSKFRETGLNDTGYHFVDHHDIQTREMTKSNPFDYKKRRNSGAPLGAIISENFKKQLEKQTKSARKLSSASAISANDSSEKKAEHTVLLVVPGRELGDDGVAAMVLGIEEALKSGTRGASLVLEEIDLRNNKLTTASLAKVAPIIELSKLHLKTLVLSGNEIKVSTDEEAQQFETFLLAFKGCMMLRCIDLSGNTELGSRAFEVLARVHSREPAIDPISAHGERPVFSASEESLNDTVAPHDVGHKVGVTGGFDTMFDAGFLQRRCGLRSLPYLEVHNVGLNEAGALWLSFVLQDHYMPSQLVNQHNAVAADTTHSTYSQNSVGDGINWSTNGETLGKDGLKLLKQTEKVRKKTCLKDTATLGDVKDISSAEHTAARRFSSSKASIYTLRSDDGDEDVDVVELESMRKKLQRQVIEHDSVNGAELYGVAVAAVLTSRKLAYMAPTTRKLLGRPMLLISDASIEITPQPKTRRLDSLTGVTEEDAPDAQRNHETQTPPSSLSRKKGRSYAATLATINVPEPGQTSLAITEVTNTPVTPKRTFKAHRKGGFSEGSDMDLVTEKLASVGVTIERDDFIEYQQKYHGDSKYRDTATACHLPLKLFNKVMDFVLGANAMGVLNEEQKRAAYAWGQNKATLVTEEDWLKHQESAQKWMLLEAVGCLSYVA